LASGSDSLQREVIALFMKLPFALALSVCAIALTSNFAEANDSSVAKLKKAGVTDSQRLHMFGDCENKITGGFIGTVKTMVGVALDLYNGSIPGLTVDFVQAWKDSEATQGCQAFLTDHEINYKYFPPLGTPGHHYVR
jgi:hypothetical protein